MYEINFVIALLIGRIHIRPLFLIMFFSRIRMYKWLQMNKAMCWIPGLSNRLDLLEVRLGHTFVGFFQAKNRKSHAALHTHIKLPHFSNGFSLWHAWPHAYCLHFLVLFHKNVMRYPSRIWMDQYISIKVVKDPWFSTNW